MQWNLGGIADAASRLAVAFQAAPDGLPQRVWQQLGPWTQRLLINSTEKWLPRLVSPAVCEVPIYERGQSKGPCHNQGLAQCDVCGRACCLNHCRIDQHADAVCYMCVIEAHQARRAAGHAPPPGTRPWERGPSGDNGAGQSQREVDAATLRAAYRMLGVRKDASDEELKAALRQQLGKWHPDKHRGEKAKQRAEERFKEIQTAHKVVTRARAKERAA